MKRHDLLLALFVLGGCTHGPQLKNFDAAYGPAGVASTIEFYAGSTDLKGELLAVETDALVLALANRIVRAPYTAIRAASFEGAPQMGISAMRRPREETRRQLSLLSRFPQGLRDDVLARLLAVYGQDEIETLP